MIDKDLHTINSLLDRVNDLPEIVELRVKAEWGKMPESDQKLLYDTYEKLDDILKDLVAFINVKFPGRKDLIQFWNEIDFDPKIGGFKISTNDPKAIRSAWLNGVFDLKSLIKTIKAEVILLVEDNAAIEPDSRTNNFNGNIIYNESNVSGNQLLSSSPQNKTKATEAHTSIIKQILIGILITVIGGLIIWYLTTVIF